MAHVTFEYEILVHKDRHREAEKWCRDNLGTRWSVLDNRQGRWACFWDGFKNRGKYRYHFLDSKDAVMFALKYAS